MKRITNGEVIYNFKNYLDKERLSDQIGYSGRFILNHLLNFRATLLEKKRKLRKLNDSNYQTFTINLKEVPDEEFPCIPGSNCTLLRSESPIPFFIDLKSITTPINMTGEVEIITEINPDMIKYKAYSKLPAQLKSRYYYLQNTGDGVYVYVWSTKPDFLKAISIKGIFYQPYLVEAINDCAGNLDPCYNYLTAEFPIDAEMLTELYTLALNYLLKGKSQMSDTYNDGLDTIVSNPNPFK